MAQKKDELQVIVNQQPGVITWNFEDLKNALAEKMTTYETLVYTEDTVKDAKSDLAGLRKLRKAVEDKRKEIKEHCLDPYYIIEEQAKELTALIDKPIAKIAEQVDNYEKKRKAAVKAEITGYMAEQFAPLPDGIAKKLQSKIYDSRWENATATKKSWQDAIAAALSQTQGDLGILEDIEDEFKDKAMEIYGNNLILSDALAKVNELRRQKEEILKRERQRIEAEERRKAEEAARKEAQERAKAEAEARKAQAQAAIKEEPPKPDETPKHVPGADIPIPANAPKPIPAQRTEPAQPKASERAITDGKVKKTISITGTPEQINKVLAYIKFAGATFEEVSL